MPIRSETKPNAKKAICFKKKIAETWTGMKIAGVAAAPDGVKKSFYPNLNNGIGCQSFNIFI